MRERILWLTLGLALVVAGCGSKSGTSQKAAVDADPATTAAVVNGHVITVDEVKKVVGNFERQGIQPDSTAAGATEAEKLWNTALQRLVEQEVLLEDAAKDTSINVTDADVQGSIAQLKTMAGGEEAFQNFLAQNNATEADVEKDMRSNLVLKAYFDKHVNQNPDITDVEVKAYYDSNLERFGPKPEVHASHVLIRTTSDMDDADKAEAMKKAQGVLQKAKAGSSFAALANEYTEDPSGKGKGGDLGWFQHGQMVAAFDSVAFALKPGQVSGVVETPFGYHVIKVEGKRMSEAQSLDTLSDRIKSFLGQQKAQEQFRGIVDSLVASADVQKNPPPAGALSTLGTGPDSSSGN